MNEYDVGDRPRIYGSFKNENGAPTDPTGLTLKYKVGTSTAVSKVYGTDVEVVKHTTGEFYLDLDITSAMNGQLIKYRWEATGAVTGADEGSFRIRQSNFY